MTMISKMKLPLFTIFFTLNNIASGSTICITEKKLVLIVSIKQDPNSPLKEGNKDFSKNIMEHIKLYHKKIYTEYNLEKAYKDKLLTVIENDIYKGKKQTLSFRKKEHKYTNSNITIFYKKGYIENAWNIFIGCICNKKHDKYNPIKGLKKI
jgi:hypothetical protein